MSLFSWPTKVLGGTWCPDTFSGLIGLTYISSGFTSPNPLLEPMGLLLELHTEMSTMIVDTGYTTVFTVTV